MAVILRDSRFAASSATVLEVKRFAMVVYP